MEKLVDNGLVKYIGVANFPVMLLHDLLSYARIKPVVNQVEIHPYNQQHNFQTLVSIKNKKVGKCEDDKIFSNSLHSPFKSIHSHEWVPL